jgi:SAM-dependent methyltransferase
MRFPPGWGTFDLILLKSVFTHLRRGEAENYLKQIPAFLRRGGRCLASFFLLNEEQRRLGQLNRIVFHPGPDGAAYAVPDVPEAIVAYEEKDILAMAEHAGLTLERPVIYGSWSGRRDGLSHQDLLVLQSARQATV